MVVDVVVVVVAEAVVAEAGDRCKRATAAMMSKSFSATSCPMSPGRSNGQFQARADPSTLRHMLLQLALRNALSLVLGVLVARRVWEADRGPVLETNSPSVNATLMVYRCFPMLTLRLCDGFFSFYLCFMFAVRLRERRHFFRHSDW